MININDLNWLAGLLEGEGCFHIRQRTDGRNKEKRYGQPTISMVSTDEDVVRRAFAIAKVGHVNGPLKLRQIHHKPKWSWVVSKKSDVFDLMIILQPLMGKRRSEKIQEILDNFAS